MIIELMRIGYRLPYKVSKRASYWPEEKPEGRLQLVAHELDRLHAELARVFDGVERLVPSASKSVESERRPAAFLKGIEDALDAVVCAYVAVEFLEGRTTAFGDSTSTIWVPLRSAVKGQPPLTH